ncbi:MAG: nucleotidyltransferase family protein, partial [Rhizobiales bacterium]|nr:nucleotidyltransferase family protein [Hyphomicrobiales bacterium]
VRDFDDIAWPEMRLLVQLAPRLHRLDPANPVLQRVDGIAKHLWTSTQLALFQSGPILAALNRAGIPFVVFKGAAQYAEGLARGRRIMGDVDLLVHRGKAVAALDVLEAEGWQASNGESFDLLRELARIRLSGNFRKGTHGEVDLHISPFHFARLDFELDESFWGLAQPAMLAGQSVRVPDPTDSILLLLAHSTTSESGDWAMDIAARLTAQPIDWPALSNRAARRGIVPACLSSLRYLREELGVPVPEEALARLAAVRVPLGERLKAWSNIRDRAERGLVEKAANRVADRMLRKRGFSVVVKDRRAIFVGRS